MRIDKKLFLLAVMSFGISSPGVASQQERSVVVRSHSANPLPPDQLRLRGRGTSGGNFEVLADRENGSGALLVQVRRMGRKIGRIRLEAARFPRMDLNTLTVEAGNAGELVVVLNYGDEKPGCFVDNDGRDQLAIYFAERAQPRLYPSSLPAC